MEKTRLSTSIVAVMALLLAGPSLNAQADAYTVTELGGFATFAYRINNAEQVVGETVFDGGQPGNVRAFLWDASSGMQDIGVLSGNWADAYAVNNQGQVVGRSDGPTVRPFLWDPTTGMHDLGSLGGNDGVAYGINDMGEVVGRSDLSVGPTHAFIWDTTRGIRDIGAGVAYSINNEAQVVGVAHNVFPARAFLWDASNGMRYLGTLGGASEANDINDAGQVVGCADNVAIGQSHACLWDSVNGVRDLGALGSASHWSCAYGINNKGQVVGESQTDDNHIHAFVWDSVNGMRDLCDLARIGDPLADQYSSLARDINDTGQIVGRWQGNGYGAFLLTPIPEPSSIVGLLCGFGALACRRRTRILS